MRWRREQRELEEGGRKEKERRKGRGEKGRGMGEAGGEEGMER